MYNENYNIIVYKNKKGDVIMNIETKKNFIINFLFFVLIIAIIVIGCKYILPFLTPFLIGFCIAFILKKPISFVSEKIHIKYKYSAIFFISLFYIIIGLIFTFLGFKIFSFIESIFSELPIFYKKYIEDIITIVSGKVESIITQISKNESLLLQLQKIEAEILSFAGSLISKISIGTVNFASNFAKSIPVFFIKFILMIISSFFIAIDYNKITLYFKKQIGDKTANLIIEIKKYLFGTVFTCIKSYTVIVLITFIELSIALTVIGINKSILIAFCIAIFDILPVFGTGGIMIPWGIVCLITGDIKIGICLFIIYLIVTIIRNVIEPKIVGNGLGLHPLITLISMFVGVNLAGVIGLFGFPITLSLLLYLNEKDIIKILKK